jgi:hypothetical protein
MHSKITGKKPDERQKPTVDIYPPVPKRAEGHNLRSMSELCLPVFDLYGGPVTEPPKK